VDAGAVNRSVNVYYVDTNGNPIGTPSSTTYTVTIGNTFTLIAAMHVPTIPDYEYKQWKIGASGTPQTGTNFPNPTLTSAQVIAGTDIYLIYEKSTVEVDVTVSKTITGRYADMNGSYVFMASFTDANDNPLVNGTPFTLVSGTIAAPGTGTPVTQYLTGGSLSFTLKHGQTMTIKGVLSPDKIQVAETVTDTNYIASFTDTANPGVTTTAASTGFKTVGEAARNFDFKNTRTEVIPVGIEDNAWTTAVLSLIGVAILMSGLSAVAMMKKRVGMR